MRKSVWLCFIALLLFLVSCGTNENTSTPEERTPSQSPALSPTAIVFDYTPTPTVTLSKIRPEQPELSDSDASKAFFGWLSILNHQDGCSADSFYEEYRKRKVNFDQFCLGRGRIGVWVQFDIEEQNNGNISDETARRLDILSDISFSEYEYHTDDKELFLKMSFEDYTYENLVLLLKKENVSRVVINYFGADVDG